MRISPTICFGIVLLAGPARGLDDPRPKGAEARAGPEARACAGSGRFDRLSGVSERGELALETGSTIRLVGLRLPADEPFRASALAVLRHQIGRPVRVEEASGSDRWGRVPARLAPDSASGAADLGAALLEQGLALFDPTATEILCGPDLLVYEEAARARGLGVWADGRYKAVAAAKPERLRERIGQFVLVEGRIRNVGERRQRTYLNFGADWASDFTIVIPKRVFAALLLRHGLTAAALAGRAIRARGILEDWQGPALTVTLPEAIEFLDDEQRQR